jgi:zinc protease
VWEKTLAVLYPATHPYNWATIGSMEDLTAATLDDVKDFFKTYYAPNNASMALVGDFDTRAAKAVVEKLFGAIPPGPPVSRVDRWVPRLQNDVDLVVQDRVQLPRMYFSWHTVPIYDGDDAALDAFSQVLGGGKTSRLYQELVYKRQIAQDAVAFHMSSQVAGVFQMMLTPRPGHTTAEVEAAAKEVLDLALEKGITAEELERVRTSTMADFVRAMQSIGGFGGIADRLNSYHHHLGNPEKFGWDLQRYLDLDQDRVLETARKYLRAPRVAVRVVPLGEMEASTSPEATTLDRTKMPAKGPESAFHLPTRERFTMANGMQVFLVEHHALPLVSFSMVVPGGSTAEPEGEAGLSSLVAALMQEGAGGRTSKELADAVEALGAQLDLQASTDAMVAQLSTLKGKMDESLALMADVILRPDFPADELERQRTRRLVQLRQVLDQPQYIAYTVGQKVIFGSHPYGRPALGTPEAVAAITLDDVKGFWKGQFVAGNARLIVVGDVTRAEVEAALTKAFGTWAKGSTAAVSVPPIPAARARTIYLVDKPGAAQSVILAGLPGVARTTPDYAALEVVNTALGGQFVSRLNLNLREDKGYTYGARTRFDYGVSGGDFVASAPVQTKVTAPALKEMLTELADIAGKRPLTKEELAYSVGSIVNGYARRFATPGQIASELGDVVLYGLPDDAPETFPGQIQAVTIADATRVAGLRIPADKVAIVVVGDAKAIRADLEALKVGTIVELDREGNPLK